MQKAARPKTVTALLAELKGMNEEVAAKGRLLRSRMADGSADRPEIERELSRLEFDGSCVDISIQFLEDCLRKLRPA